MTTLDWIDDTQAHIFGRCGDGHLALEAQPPAAPAYPAQSRGGGGGGVRDTGDDRGDQASACFTSRPRNSS
jgi:hypothetical protein